MLYKFSPVYITPISDGRLCGQLEKCMSLVKYHSKESASARSSKIALYSIDAVRKLLLNHRFNNEFIFDQLDLAREAEMKNDEEFWTPSGQVRAESDLRR